MKEDKEFWIKILNYCPELNQKEGPKDRTFFFNILNTIKLYCVDKVVYNAIKQRDDKVKAKIANEITVIPEFRKIFTDELSLIGTEGRTMKEMRTDHPERKSKYADRKKYEVQMN